METNFENFLKKNLSADEFDAPDVSLVNEARQKIMARKKTTPERPGFFESIRLQFEFFIKPLPAGITAVLIIGSIFYFANHETQKSSMALNPNTAANNYSISSSTVLASLTQYTNNKTATASSTVLTSIMTFVVKN